MARQYIERLTPMTKIGGDCSRLLVAASVIWLSFAAGCSPKQDVTGHVAAQNRSNIQRLANLYQSYQLRHGMNGPKDETAFRNYIQHEMPSHRLEMMQVDPDNVDQLFTSERDGQPLRVRYQVGGGRGWVVAVVFEQEGENGMRQVAFTGGSVEEVDELRYRELLEDPGRSSSGVQRPAAEGTLEI